ncbi:MAG: response regulator transcription factor [Bacteroidaceae bacterium]|nr:response regulator transcription factor [Bacteroidaceae bacterium]
MDFIIADNQEITRFAVEHLLVGFPGKRILHASKKTELIEQLKEHEQSVVIIDYTLFDFFDAQNLLIISQRFPAANWLLFSDDLTDSFLRTIAYQSQNMSILFKDAPLREFTEAIRSILSGRRYFCQRVTEILLAQKLREEVLPSTLTATEIEVMRAIAQGKTTKEIANERFSSIHTINTHRKNIFRKLQVNTAHEAIRVAIRSGLIDESDYFI